MTDFSHLQDRRLATIDIPIEGIEGMRPVLQCKPATKANKKYFNALLRSERRGLASRGSRMTVDQLNAFMGRQRELVAQHCVVGWTPGSVVDAKGKNVAFSRDECLAFLQALPDRLFDPFLGDLQEEATFLDEGGDGGADDPADVEEQAGN